MVLLKTLKAAKSYFNGFFDAVERLHCTLEISIKDGVSILSMHIKNQTISYSIYTPELKDNSISVSFNAFYNAISGLKGVAEVNFELMNDYLIIGDEKILVDKIVNIINDFPKNRTVPLEQFCIAYNLNSLTMRTSPLDFQKNLYFNFDGEKLAIISNCNGLVVENIVNNTNGKDFAFGIENNNLSILKKWLDYASNPKKILEEEFLISFSEESNLIKISADCISYEVPVFVDKNIFTKLNKIINFDYEKESSNMDLQSIADSFKKENEIKDEETFGYRVKYPRPLYSSVAFNIRELEYKQYKIISESPVVLIDGTTPYDDTFKMLIMFKKDKEDVIEGEENED